MLGFVIALVVFNYIVAKTYGYPFLHCFVSPVVWPIYDAWGQYMSIGLMGYAVFCLMRGAIISFVVTCFMWVVLLSLPQFANTLFKLGGSCG